MKRRSIRLLSLLLAIVLLLGVLPAGEALALGDAMSLTQVRALLNAEPLYPQPTGCPALDKKLDNILAPYRNSDTYTKIKAAYDWTVNNVHYSWEGYSQDWAPAYDKFTLTYDLEYEEGAERAYPEDMIFRAYHMLTDRTGVCYDWGILFCILARYVGIEAYVHTGILRIGSWTGHHGWTELVLGGKYYIFDAQQDNRMLYDVSGVNQYEHFGIPTPAARWQEETYANAQRDAQLLPLTVKITPQASRSGTAAGGGVFPRGAEVTVTASGDRLFLGWYDSEGELLSRETSYRLTVSENATLFALFYGDVFADIPANAWYLSAALKAKGTGLISGATTVTFEGEAPMTRAMLVTLLARMEGARPGESAPFTDVDPEKWYAEAVSWAYENGVAAGVTKESFAPNAPVTREQAASIIMRYLRLRGFSEQREETELAYTDRDQIGNFARKDMAALHDLGLLSGYTDGSLRPKNSLNRAEAVSLLLRVKDCLNNAA